VALRGIAAGMSKPTINDVARLAGVSKKTVSRVINNSPLLSDATRAKVEGVIEELGFTPDPQARALALRRNFLVALVHDLAWPSSLLDIQQGMLAALHDSDYALCIHLVDTRGDDPIGAFRDFLEYHRPASVLLIPPLSESETMAEIASQHGCNHVRILHDGARQGPCLLLSDDRYAVAGCVDRLISMGHRRIAFITGPERDATARQRELGYLDAMADHGLDRGPALIESAANTLSSGKAAAQSLLQVSPRPTTIIASNDEMAAGALHAAKEADIRVPTDLSILACCDSPIAQSACPPLSALRIPNAEMAYEATLLLLAAQGKPDRTAHFVPELVERGSIAPPKN